MNIPGIPSIWLMLGLFLAGAAGSAYITREVYTGRIAKIELAHAQAVIDAETKAREDQRAIDQIAIDAAGSQAIVQEKIVTKYRTIERDVHIYVQDSSNCITYGLVRVHDAAAYGADPKSLTLPAGQSDDACAPVGWRTLASTFTGNYRNSNQNSAQLTGLQDYVRDVAGRLGAP